MKSPGPHTHHIRHRDRIETPSNHLRKLDAHAVEVAAQLNAINGVVGVTPAEVIASIRNNVAFNPNGVRDMKAAYQRGVIAIDRTEALGIPII